ncbi:hypothetical protein N24_2405 [Corynebacterium suranareeae]|uniref:SCP domain-containing protein n=1 Tax=Corynebacterium suranareeae TaxID=2506452 RepID=A0A160PR61_9CORY|nr:CAP domain-containing protein [Corynebacterium suranareeae]BAU96667.1 hypothetical protein N24_2405 [Corynebacterium suranareeae]
MTFFKVSAFKRVGILASTAAIALASLQAVSASPVSAMGSSDLGVTPAIAPVFAQPAAAGNSSAVETAVLNQINLYRAQHGLGAVAADANLAAGAHSWAQSLTDSGAPAGHPAGGNFYENVAYCSSPERAVTLWDGSPSHKNNMLQQGITRGGVGVVARPDGSYTVVFRAL